MALCVYFSFAPAGCFAAGAEAGKFYASGDGKKPQFALTFDDGPGYITADLLKLLEKHNAKASFFMLGSSARAMPGSAKMVYAAGHLVGNHTDTHMNWFKKGKSPDKEKVLAAEIKNAGAAIEKATGARPTLLRMPNGYDRPWSQRVAGGLGYTLVNWTYGSDWTKLPEEKMTAEYLKALKPGAILLLHDGGGKVREKTLRIVERILEEASKKGLKPVRLDELLGLGASPAAGPGR